MSYKILQIIAFFSLFVSGMTACSLKFGADARQAAESNKKNPPVSKFVEVDNNATEAEVATQQAASDSDKTAADGKSEAVETAKYIRVGKNRRLKRVAAKTDSMPANQQQQPIGAEKSMPEKSVTVKSLHRKAVSKVRQVHQKVVSKVFKKKKVKQTVYYPTVQLYGEKIDKSQWSITSKDIECNLSQTIEGLGKVIFNYNPVQKMRFVFRVNHPVAKKLASEDLRYDKALITDVYPYPAVGAKIESVPPQWKPFAIKKTLGYIPLQQGYEPFVLPHRQKIPAKLTNETVLGLPAKADTQLASLENQTLPEVWPDRLIYELLEGMSIRVTYRDWTDGTQDIITTISPIGFAKQKNRFQKCINKLPKYKFASIQYTTIYFTKNQRVLSKKQRKQIREMVKFAKRDKTIKKVIVKSYTDSMGFKRVNRNAAKLQAEAIKNYMQKLGMTIPITAKGIGEGKYVASNRSSAGRAKNRRSIITLIK